MNRTILSLVALALPAFAADAVDLPVQAPAMKLSGSSPVNKPLFRYEYENGTIEIPVSIDGRIEATSPFALDRDGTKSSGAAQFSPRARVGLRLISPPSWGKLSLMLEYEHDVPTGTISGTLPGGSGMPGSDGMTTQLRKAMLRLSYGEYLVVGGGVMTSNWGLGLLANDGAHGWEPGNARFTDPRGGDRVIRGFLATGPHTPLGLVAAVAIDKVLGDDSLLTSAQLGKPSSDFDDQAGQVVASVSLGRPGDTWAGVYVALRNQTTWDNRYLQVAAFDASGTYRRTLSGTSTLRLGAEVAYIGGNATLGATATFPVQQVRQLGVLTRNSLDLGGFGFALDGAFASGDGNPDDATQNGFKADPNADMGLLLFRQVIAAQTARGSAMAGDPTLVGVPAPGVERLPTRGSFTNTVSVFPRAFVRPVDGLEVYGGVLLAWSATPVFDAFNTRISGGTPRNAVNGTPSGMLGVEVDLGARFRMLFNGTEVMIGAEGGVLVPGGQFATADGKAPSSITGGRVLLGYRL
jgi:hypothetical protein